MDIEDLLPALRQLTTRFNVAIRGDLLSEAVIAVCKAKTRYDPTLGEFRPYALKLGFKAMLQFTELDLHVHVARSMRWKYDSHHYEQHSFVSEAIRNALATTFELIDVCDKYVDCSVELEKRETLEDLRTAIRRLTDQQRTFVDLRYTQGFGVTKIAEFFGLTRQRIYQINIEVIDALRRALCQ